MTEKAGIDLLATPRFYEVKAAFADDGELNGIDETKPTYLAGLSEKSPAGCLWNQYVTDST